MKLIDVLRNQTIRPKTSLPIEVVKEFQGWLSSPDFEARVGRKRTGSFYPSSFYHSCDRALALEFLKAPQNFVERDPRLIITFEFGNAMHDRLQKLFQRWAEKNSWEFVEELRITRDTNRWFVSGRVDGVFYIPMTDKRPGVEFKTIHDTDFKSLWHGPLQPHIEQGNAYLGLAPYTIDGMHYIYVNKNTSAMKEFYLPFDRQMFKESMMRIERIMLFLQQDRLPKCEKCRKSCPFYELNVRSPRIRPSQLADEGTVRDIESFKPKFLRAETAA